MVEGGWERYYRDNSQMTCHHKRVSKTVHPYLLIFLKDETPESLSWGAVASRLPNGKNDGIV